MSAPLPSLLADKLNVSDEQAKKLLIAMLREVKKRAFREGVRLPEFGTFREENGQLTFEPSSSLARSVNEQFEGLESEDLGTAPEKESTEEESTDEGPDTITLGYQDSDWSPLDSGEEASQEADTDDEAADTAEFQVPAAEEAADTDEFQAADVDDESPAESEKASAAPSTPDAPSDDADQSQTQTEELYPLVEDVPEDSEAEEDEPSPDEAFQQSVEEEQRESLSDIWDSEEESDDADSPADPEPASSSESDSAAETEPLVDPEPEPELEASPDDRAPSEVNVEPEAQEAAPSEATAAEEPSTDETERSTGALVFAGVLAFLLVGGAGWYVLGERGTVQPPQTTFAQLKTQLEPHAETLSAQVQNLSAEDLPLVGSSSSSTSPTTAEADDEAPPSAEQDAATSETSPSSTGASSAETERGGAGTSETEPDTAPTTESSTTSQPDQTDAPPPRGLDPSAGGYTVIVGSRTQSGPAESLLQKYRKAFATADVSVGILSAEVEGETRYRVGVGQFESQTEAQDFVERASGKLPGGAWVLRL